MNIDSTQVYIMMYKWSINAHILLYKNYPFHLLNRQIRTVFWEVSKRWITRSSALSYTCLAVARTILQYDCKTSQPCHHIYRGSHGGRGGGGGSKCWLKYITCNWIRSMYIWDILILRDAHTLGMIIVLHSTHLIAYPSTDGTAYNAFSNRSTLLDNTFGSHHCGCFGTHLKQYSNLIHCIKIISE